MKAKKTAPPRRRVSFAVDRDEIEINSDWVDAVMNPVASPTSPSGPAPTAVVHFPAPPDDSPVPTVSNSVVASPSEVAAKETESVFFAPGENNATDARTATDERCTSVEENAAVDNVASVAQSAPVVHRSPVEVSATVVNLYTVEKLSTGKLPDSAINPGPIAVENNTTVEFLSTDATYSTDALPNSTKDHRVSRPRSILRVTDGLTPGQYAVYSLMYEAGQGADGTARIYKGGYADLCRLTGLSKRGIQNIVAELQVKQVIRIHQQPGYHRTETSAYLVPDADGVLRTWFANGWRHALGKSKILVP